MNATTSIKRERPITEPVGRRILTDDQIDDLGEALITLTREVYVLTDRVRVLEQVLDDKGLDVHKAVDRYQVGPELQKDLDAKRDNLLNAVLKSLRAVEA
jgi:hypothetical protein